MMLLEDFYNVHFESKYNRIYNLLNDDCIRSISKEQKIEIIDTLLSMYFRVAKWFNRSKTTQEELLKEVFSNTKKLENPIIQLPEGKSIDISEMAIGEFLEEFEKGRKFNFIISQLNALSNYTKIFHDFNISINTVCQDHEFLTSDVPIILNNGEVRLVEYLNSDCQIMLNISPTKCVTLMPPTGNSNLGINRNSMPTNTSFLYTMINNDHQFRNCEQYLLGTKSGIEFFQTSEPIRTTKEAVEEIVRLAKEETEATKSMYNKFYFQHYGQKL